MAEAVQTLNLIKDFSRYPAGRNKRDGRFSGEAFRDDVLWPRLKAPGVHVDLLIDGVAGLPSSFWEEVFGGLVRRHGMAAAAVRERVHVKTSEPDLQPYVQLAYRFADEAARAKPV